MGYFYMKKGIKILPMKYATLKNRDGLIFHKMLVLVRVG